jgi:6-phosphogluconolactonase
MLRFTGSSINRDRQLDSHPHSVAFSADHRYLYIPDLGSDNVWVYRWLGNGSQPAATNDPAAIALPAGSGPRIICFPPHQQHAYLINELSATVTAYSYDGGNGNLIAQHETSILPPTVTGAKGAAHIAPYRDTVLASNRGYDIITTIHDNSAIAYAPTEGKTPRYFLIDQSADQLYVANQNSNTIIRFQLTPQGTLANPQLVAKLPRPPSCLAIGLFE